MQQTFGDQHFPCFQAVARDYDRDQISAPQAVGEGKKTLRRAGNETSGDIG